MVVKGFGRIVLSQDFALQKEVASPDIPMIWTLFFNASFKAPGLVFFGGPLGPSCVTATMLFCFLKTRISFFITGSHPLVLDPVINLYFHDSKTFAKI